MQALLRLTAELMSTEGVRLADQFSELVQKVQPFRYLKARISDVAWNRAWVVDVPLLRPDLPSLFTASGKKLGESREEGPRGECQLLSWVL